MKSDNDLDRFLTAQKNDYLVALQEIKSGRKRSHWMWYIFPQIAGLGYSEMAKHYAINSVVEAEAYLKHPLLGARLIEIARSLLLLDEHDAKAIFGSPDDLKLKSCATLFSLVAYSNPVFSDILEKFFDGEKDQKTLEIINGGRF